jgi:hypothetical protein
MLVEQFKVESEKVTYAEDHIASTYDYQHTEVDRTPEGGWVLRPQTTSFEFKTDTRVPKLGCVAAPRRGRCRPAARTGPARRNARAETTAGPGRPHCGPPRAAPRPPSHCARAR